MSACFNLLDHPIALAEPQRILAVSEWREHVPFAMFLVDVLKPRVVTELGTHYGVSYCAFCQAVCQLDLDTRCFAVDTWAGDSQAGYYANDVLADLRQHHDPLYANFSTLMQMDFDEAARRFEDETIDLLHIDGLHTYEAVKHDFETWLPKMSSRGVVLFHDTNVTQPGFGVKDLWQQVAAKYPHFEFLHHHGLGVLAVGEEQPPDLRFLLGAPAQEVAVYRDLFSQLGRRFSLEAERGVLQQQMRELEQQLEKRSQKLEGLKQSLREKEHQITSMQSSAFWKLRTRWLNLKRQVGSAKDS